MGRACGSEIDPPTRCFFERRMRKNGNAGGKAFTSHEYISFLVLLLSPYRGGGWLVRLMMLMMLMAGYMVYNLCTTLLSTMNYSCPTISDPTYLSTLQALPTTRSSGPRAQ